jgi:3-oxoacyl-[acyl-carrier-protein] synthase II
MKNGFLGPSLSPSTACTTGAHAIGDAFNLIRYSVDTDIVLAGASESCIDPLAVAGFARARALSTASRQQDKILPDGNNHAPSKPEEVKPGASSRPFDKQRDGFVIAEGAAVLVLEELTHAQRRGANIYAEIVGYGCASDAHHITAPHPSGRGAYLSMKRALQDASIKPVDVSYINAHATSTPTGDDAENRAIRKLMLDPVDGKRHSREVNVSSTKGATGHLLGAAGALEGVFSVLAVHEDIMPPTINLASPGNLDGEYHEEWDLNYVASDLQRANVDVVLSNSFGFGGTCASLCFKKYTDTTG